MEQDLHRLLRFGNSLEELIEFINRSFHRKARTEGWKSWRYEPRQIAAMLARPGRFYKTFEIPKKSGAMRRIDAPRDSLKKIQWSLVPVFSEMFNPSDAAFGFIRGRGIVENALRHSEQPIVLNVDIKGFFPSISEGRLVALFRRGPGLHMSEYMAKSLARLCTLRGKLPQGSPASPVLTNFVSTRLDARLIGLSRRFNCRYSRYVDDITFSSSSLEALHGLEPALQQILGKEGFKLNPEKTRIQLPSMRQEVTGLVLSQSRLNDGGQVNTPRSYRRQVRAMLHSWRKKGLFEAAQIAGVVSDDPASAFISQVRGRMAHMRHVSRTEEVERMHREMLELLKLESE